MSHNSSFFTFLWLLRMLYFLVLVDSVGGGLDENKSLWDKMLITKIWWALLANLHELLLWVKMGTKKVSVDHSICCFRKTPKSASLMSRSNTNRGGSHVFAAVWDLGLVGVVGTADHWAGGREAMASHHAATGLTWRHPSLPQLPVACAGRAPFGVHDGHGGPAFVVEDSRAQTHRDSYKEYSAYTLGTIQSYSPSGTWSSPFKRKASSLQVGLHNKTTPFPVSVNSCTTQRIKKLRIETHRSRCVVAACGKWRHCAGSCYARRKWRRKRSRWLRSACWSRWWWGWVLPSSGLVTEVRVFRMMFMYNWRSRKKVITLVSMSSKHSILGRSI